jgi:hypothetical protein
MILAAPATAQQKAPLTIYRDDFGASHIYADSEETGFYGLANHDAIAKCGVAGRRGLGWTRVGRDWCVRAEAGAYVELGAMPSSGYKEELCVNCPSFEPCSLPVSHV